MPVVAALAIVAMVLLAAVALMPLALVQRYRVGTARRAARHWVVTLNFVSVTLAAGLFVVSAAVTTIWISNALPFTLIGLAAGLALGLLGLRLTHWEATSRSLHYTPNKWLVLGITLAVAGRIAYGFWRGWQTWRAGLDGTLLLETAGLSTSMAAAAMVLGYYTMFWSGVRRRLLRSR